MLEEVGNNDMNSILFQELPFLKEFLKEFARGSGELARDRKRQRTQRLEIWLLTVFGNRARKGIFKRGFLKRRLLGTSGLAPASP